MTSSETITMTQNSNNEQNQNQQNEQQQQSEQEQQINEQNIPNGDDELDLSKAIYSEKQEYSTLQELKNYIKTPFYHCPQVTFRYLPEFESKHLTTYLKEVKNNINCFENITFVILFSKSIDDLRYKQHKTIIGGYQKEFKVECNVKTNKMKVIIDYNTQFTYMDEILNQKYASWQQKLQNLEGVHLQRDLFEAIFLIKQMHKFTSLEFAISKVFLPMDLHKTFEFWSDLRVLIISSDKSKITIDQRNKMMQIKLFAGTREIVPSLPQILGDDMCENYAKIVICEYPFTKTEIQAFEYIKNIIVMRINLNVDFTIKQYSITDLFEYFATQPNMFSLYFRCLPFPTAHKLNDDDFNSICKSVIKMKNLTKLYLDINFKDSQLLRVNRIEFKINQKQMYIQLLRLFKLKYPQIHEFRWEVKFELFNMFLTEKMRILSPTLPFTERNIKKQLVYFEYFVKY